jgi:hypothetical protein
LIWNVVELHFENGELSVLRGVKSYSPQQCLGKRRMTDNDNRKSVARLIAERPFRQPVAPVEKHRQRSSGAVPSKKGLRIGIPREGARGETDDTVWRIYHPLVPHCGQKNRMLHALHIVRERAG